MKEEQIVSILKQVESGRLVKDVCRGHGISEATYHKWKSKYGGMEISDVKRLKELEQENRKPKQMFAYLSLENRVLKDVIKKKALKPAEKRGMVDFMQEEHHLSLRSACRALAISRSVYGYHRRTPIKTSL